MNVPIFYSAGSARRVPEIPINTQLLPGKYSVHWSEQNVCKKLTCTTKSIQMSSFVSEEAGAKGSPDNEGLSSTQMIDFAAPVQVIYCPTCSMPCEFCEYGACFSKCLPWIMENCREALSAVKLAEVENSAGGVTEVIVSIFKLFLTQCSLHKLYCGFVGFGR